MLLLLKSLKNRGHCEIEPINIAVEITGSSALTPGNAVFSSNMSVATANPIAPSHGRNLLFKKAVGMKRRSAPIPSSHALVGSE